MDVTSFILDDNSDQDFEESEGTHQNHVVSGDVTTDSDDDVSIESGCVSWDSDYSNGEVKLSVWKEKSKVKHLATMIEQFSIIFIFAVIAKSFKPLFLTQQQRKKQKKKKKKE